MRENISAFENAGVLLTNQLRNKNKNEISTRKTVVECKFLFDPKVYLEEKIARPLLINGIKFTVEQR